MRLASKLLASHLLVVGVSTTLFALLTAILAPRFASQDIDIIYTRQSNGQTSQQMTTTQADAVLPQTQAAVGRALLVAGTGAGMSAIVLSWMISRQIVRPLRAVAENSRIIAQGRYEARLKVHSGDELGELTDSFNQMAAALSEIESTRRQLIADVSHELKTPLASVKGYMEGLRDGVIVPAPEVFQLIHHEIQRLQILIEDLQALSRIEAGALPLSLMDCDSYIVVKSIAVRLLPQYQSKEVTLKIEIEPDLPSVSADPDRLTQVLTNLLGNALQYTESGGAVTVNAQIMGKAVRFSVKDTGIGLAPGEIEKVFLRFYRVDRSRSRLRGGSGIGLTIARLLVEAQGGRIWAESEGIGLGCVFYFTLPLAHLHESKS